MSIKEFSATCLPWKAH